MSKQLQYNFSGKVAFITGASTGIGQSTAKMFAEAKSSVVMIDVNEEIGQKNLLSLQELGVKVKFIKCDVSKSNEVKAALDKTMEIFGRLDFAFNNAGIEGTQAFTENSEEANWDRVININLKGVWNCMRYQIPLMKKQGGGAIVNCSSIAGLIGFPGIPAYVASKHGVIGLTKTAALECAKENIRINAVCPGVIQTPMIDRFVHGEAQIRQQLVAGEPIGRVGQPDEVGAAVLWLCSEGASFITGDAIPVDGGWVAQ